MFRCFDRITGNVAQPKTVVCGVAFQDRTPRMLKDWEVLAVTNKLAANARPALDSDAGCKTVPAGDETLLKEAESLLRGQMSSLDVPFRQPDLELLVILQLKGTSCLRTPWHLPGTCRGALDDDDHGISAASRSSSSRNVGS